MSINRCEVLFDFLNGMKKKFRKKIVTHIIVKLFRNLHRNLLSILQIFILLIDRICTRVTHCIRSRSREVEISFDGNSLQRENFLQMLSPRLRDGERVSIWLNGQETFLNRVCMLETWSNLKEIHFRWCENRPIRSS